MTKEEAIEILEKEKAYMLAHGGDSQVTALEMAINSLEQQTNDCKIFGTKENCFGGATENECEHCDYKIQKLEQQPYEDCVSRQAVQEVVENTIAKYIPLFFGQYEKIPLELALAIKDLPPVTPTHGTCKDCEWLTTDEDGNYYCRQTGYFDSLDFYCADFEKRGNENGSN